MTSDVTNRATVRKQLANLLQTTLVGTNLPVKAVYAYQASDFKETPAVVITGAGTERGTSLIADPTDFLLEIHAFVLYAEAPFTASNSPTAGLLKIINLSDTSAFTVGMPVKIEDDSNSNVATVTTIVANVSITVSILSHSYTTPKVFIWTEDQSEDHIDLIDKMIGDVIADANESGLWSSVQPNGQSEIDVVEIGGVAYRHEMTPVRITVEDYQ